MPVETPRTPPTTTDECVERIRALGLLVAGHVQFMCAVEDLAGTSGEAKHHAATRFWERLSLIEGALARTRGEVSRRNIS
jgi:hypothetical protein